MHIGLLLMYILDIVAMDGWFHRTKAGLLAASQISADTRGVPNDCKLPTNQVHFFLKPSSAAD